ncbi:MAG: NAD(P)H-dependent oxidoreductase, partial [Gammaproteobacteria bacterium]|nr:NAD(P)H-dependent oxidoreductase [Gammaproteobacteria bacterium]
MKHLLIVFHSQSGNTKKMAQAVFRGAKAEEIGGVEVRMLEAFDAGVEDLLWADALILGTPENFGYMSGGMKDFLDRTFYPCEGKLEGMPYSIFVSAGNDGSGAVTAIERIANGYAFRKIQEPLIARGELTTDHLEQCQELGMAVAAG